MRRRKCFRIVHRGQWSPECRSHRAGMESLPFPCLARPHRHVVMTLKSGTRWRGWTARRTVWIKIANSGHAPARRKLGASSRQSAEDQRHRNRRIAISCCNPGSPMSRTKTASRRSGVGTPTNPPARPGKNTMWIGMAMGHRMSSCSIATARPMRILATKKDFRSIVGSGIGRRHFHLRVRR